jgi:endonuclease/exonuclease/phosphatase (EEP) superfamily protein YafD
MLKAMTPMSTQRLVPVLGVYPVVVTAASILSLVAPQRGGPLGLGQVFAPHILVPVLLLLPVAIVSSSRALRLGVVVALVVGLLRFGPGLVSLPPSPAASGEGIVRVTSWNLEAGAPAASALVERLRASDADVVALQELTPEHAAAILADPAVTARFPHRALAPQPGVSGIGLLSRLPIESSTNDVNPVVQAVVLDLPNRDLTIVNAHPFPPRYRVWNVLPLPFAYDPSQRDADIRRIREPVDRAIADGRPVLVVGDYNLTDREPAFEDLSRGLWDAHEEVGLGIGSTWRPSRLEFLPLGVLRIDHFLGGPGTRPLDVREDCTPRGSDHCILLGEAAIAGG